jgi:hypothetical protein
MTEMTSEVILQLLERSWGDATDRGDHHRAMGLANIAYSYFHEREDVCEVAALILIKTSCEKILNHQGNGDASADKADFECSFCSKSGADAKLIAGAGGFICKDCAISVMGIFSE